MTCGNFQKKLKMFITLIVQLIFPLQFCMDFFIFNVIFELYLFCLRVLRIQEKLNWIKMQKKNQHKRLLMWDV